MSSDVGFKLGKYGYDTIQRKMNKEDMRLLSSVYYDVVTDDREFLTREDLKVAIVELFGYKPSKYEADQILNTYGLHYDGKPGLTLPQFIEAMAEKMTRLDMDEHIRHAFMAFDCQCKGFLTADDLRKAFGQVAPHIPQHTIETTFRELDRDGDGRISFKDFEFMMKYNTSDHI